MKNSVDSKILIQKSSIDDLESLRGICVKSYTANFAKYWEGGTIENYVNSVFGLNELRLEILDPCIYYFVASLENQAVGFMKLVIDTKEPTNMELDKIYLMPQFKGFGVGKLLWKKALEVAKLNILRTITLNVIDSNFSAIRFYEGLGFRANGKGQLNFPGFKDDLRGMLKMIFNLNNNEW